MTTKKFIIKNIIKIVAFAIISTIAMTLLQSPVITNEIAMGQMENSNELFILMDTYYKMKPIVLVIYGCIVALFVSTIGYDTYKFINTKTKEKN